MKEIGNWLLPISCLFCHQPCRNELLCQACWEELPWQLFSCYKCGQLLPTADVHICGQCLKIPPVYDNTICLFHYQNPIDKLILALKFSEKLSYAKLLGELMYQVVRQYYQNQSKPDCIIPVPLHDTRLRERGYNQALEIAKPISKKLKMPLETKRCKRILATAPQSATLSIEERAHNIKRAFWVDDSLRWKHVVILDDVVTTGHTVTALAIALKKAGVDRIDVWCCARTHLKMR